MRLKAKFGEVEIESRTNRRNVWEDGWERHDHDVNCSRSSHPRGFVPLQASVWHWRTSACGFFFFFFARPDRFGHDKIINLCSRHDPVCPCVSTGSGTGRKPTHERAKEKKNHKNSVPGQGGAVKCKFHSPFHRLAQASRDQVDGLGALNPERPSTRWAHWL